ncbi:MAG: Asp-tRNA(Asn)/Glu-tRNA(Gln) amidotransferase subunit GatA [Daejeonella sp.]
MENLASLAEIQSAIKNNELNLPDLADHYLKRIHDNWNLNAFVEVFEDDVKKQAIEIQKKIENNTAGILAGMLIGIKDNICYRGHLVSACSKILENYTSPYSATVVERLIAQDAIIIGRLNCDEFAMGASNESSVYGPVKNYADQTKVSGGSSGGAAVAVQAGLCLAALGTDTGGSVRQPAAFCGVFGLKPTYGRVSRYGIISYASSFDQVGPITKTIEDAAILLQVIAGTDDFDSTVSSKSVPKYIDTLALTGKKKIAYFFEVLNAPALDPEIKAAFEKSIAQLKADGNTVEAISFKYVDFVVPAYYILTMAEASSNLARYDGVHFGYRDEEASDLETTYKKSRSQGFGAEVKRRIMLGTFILSSGYYDAYYSKAQKVRRLIRDKTDEILQQYDFILTPTTPTPAFSIGEKDDNPVIKYLADIFTVQASLAGLPAISIPAGNNKKGLPLGLQLIGKRFAEADLLAFARYFEQNLVKI